QQRYGIDTSELRQSLALNGVVLNVSQGAANYCQTYMSIASMLNMGYLDALGAWPDSRSMSPALALIRKAPAFDLLKKLGYRIEFVGSAFVGTVSHPAADVCRCGPVSVGDLESALI